MQALPIAELELRWLEAGDAFFGNDDKSQVRPFKDLDAEYRLRKLKPPHDQLAPALDKAMERLKRYKEKDLERVHRRLGAFLEDLKKPKN